MNGKEEYKTAKDQLEKWDKILDEYERSVGLPAFSTNRNSSAATEFLSMDRNQIEKLSPEDCAQAALILNELAFHVQRAYNREIARVKWSEDTSKEVVANEVGGYKGYSYAERFQQAVKNNAHALSLNKIRKYAQQRADRLSFLASNMNTRADIFLATQRSKRYSNAN